MAGNILDELEGLIGKVSQRKQAMLKTSADVSTKLDNADDGTSTATTGEQAKDMQKAKDEQYADNTADTGAKDSKAGTSVSESTDGAAAVSTTGQEGATGGKLGDEGEVSDNAKTAPDIPKNDGFDSGAFKAAAANCLKIAASLEKAADALLTPFDRFLVQSMRNHADPQIKQAAVEMPDDQLAASASDSLTQEIESGSISDEEAAQILQEAVQAGAISEDEVAEAAQMAQAAMDQAGAPEGGAPAGDVGAGGADDALLEAKLAAADIGPDHPRYLQKLAQLYAADLQAGYSYGMQLAQKLAQEADMESGESEGKEGEEEEAEGEEEEAEGGETKTEAPAKPLEGQETPAEEAAEATATAPMPEAAAPVSDTGALGGMMPSNPNEQQDMTAIGAELGLTPEQLAQLMQAPVPPQDAATMGKIAAALKQGQVPYRARLRTVLLNKVAALQR